MAIDTRNLQGARASSAVRCIARAEWEGLNTPRDDNTPVYLKKAFKRGLKIGKLWARQYRDELISEGRNPDDLELEAEIPWGIGWFGHADLIDHGTHTVYEAYHNKQGAYVEAKGWQAAFYADELGPEWGAELSVIDTSDEELTADDDDDGFAVQPYVVGVDGLRAKVRDIKRRVVAAVEAGAVNPADKVGDSPNHSECRSCPFRDVCWPNWQPPAPDQIVGLETTFEELRITESDLHHTDAKIKLIKERRDGLRDQVREYLPAGAVVECGGTVIRRTEVAGRVSVKLTDFRKAGYELPPEMEPFVSESKPSERWKVDPARDSHV